MVMMPKNSVKDQLSIREETKEIGKWKTTERKMNTRMH